jgi:ribosomal protein S18 acetylase RimI-like enzyme
MPITPIHSLELYRIREIANITWPISYKDMISLKQIDYMLESMYSDNQLNENIKNGREIYVFTHQKKDKGFIEIGTELNIGRIEKCYIIPSEQGKGFGEKLIHFALKNFKKKGISSIQLNVNKNNPAISFYQKIGFKIQREIIKDIGNGFIMDDYLMIYDITPNKSKYVF